MLPNHPIEIIPNMRAYAWLQPDGTSLTFANAQPDLDIQPRHHVEHFYIAPS